MIQSLVINVAALELLPETDPIGLGGIQLGCGNTRVFVCNESCIASCGVTVQGA